MTTGSTRTKRRVLLQRGLALATGGAAIAGGARWAAAASPPATSPNSLTLFARKRPASASPDGRLIASGELLAAPDGDAIGSFHTNSFGVQSPFAGQAVSTAGLEFHVLQLADGTLFTIGAGESGANRALAIVGGTGRFAGRSGTCIERGLAARLGEDLRELTVTFAG